MKSSDARLELVDKFGEKKRLQRKKLIFTASMNQYSEGGGVPMAPEADAYDGLLDQCIASNIPKWQVPFMFLLLLFGKQKWVKRFEILRCRSCKVKTKSPQILHADGEYLGTVDAAEFQVLPGKLRLL